MTVVVVGVAVTVDEILPAHQVDALKVRVVKSDPESTMHATTPLPVKVSGAGWTNSW